MNCYNRERVKFLSKSIASNEMSLVGMQVLLTRPRDRADDIKAAIVAAGGSAIHIPMLAVAPLQMPHDQQIWQQTRQRIIDLDRYQRVLAISINAVHYGMQCLAEYWPQWPIGIHWYGIGAATIAEFARWDIRAHGGSAAMSSEGLLALPELQNIAGERILILRGVGGRETLATILRERGAQVDYAECYRRVEPTLDATQQSLLRAVRFDAISINSGETLQNLMRYDNERLRATPLIVPSARVADAANALGFSRVITAANAGTAATLAALQSIKEPSIKVNRDNE